MASIVKDIQYKLTRLNALEIIIVINIVVYIIGFLMTKILSVDDAFYWFKLPSDFFDFLQKPWTIFTYGFIHYGFFHILFNLLVLYIVSRIVLNLFKPKMALSIYFLGIIFGGLSFLLVYNVIPSGILYSVTGLVGASAGVRALLIFICAYMPQTEVRLAFWNVKLMYIGIAVVVIDIIGLFSSNQGGNIAHLGGSLLGYVYANQLEKGTDIGTGFQRLMDWIANMFKTKPRGPLKTVYKSKSNSVAGHNKKEFKEFNKQKQIDLILDKIGKSGYESLTKEEKEFLFKVGKE
ncbi:MAG: rhomboid family intramembrane serine protease [Aquaticitalea sp.]